MLNLFIGRLDGKMDGNHSLLAGVHQLFPCGDLQTPVIINIVLGLPANMYVMWLILAGPGEKAAEVFSLNQAICEVAICVSNVIYLIAMNIAISSVVSLTYLWHVVRFSFGLGFLGRPLFLSCVCLECYLAVVHPVTFLKYKLLRYRLAGAVISWLTVLVCCVIFIWVPHSSTYYVCFSMAFSCFLVKFFCCVEVLRALRHPGPGDGNQESRGMNTAKLRAFRIILIILVSEALIYLPYAITTIFLDFLSDKGRSALLCIAFCVALVTGFMPPFLYIYKAGKLKYCFRDTAT